MKSDCVEMALTHLGAHMAPVTFYLDSDKPVQPYYISPWQDENLVPGSGRSERVLRGDFFCMPFGADSTPYNNEKHPAHGETASSPWSLAGSAEDAGVKTLTIELQMKARPGRVERAYSLVKGENVVYDCTTIHGFEGPINWAHHAVMNCNVEERGLLLSTSPLLFGMVYPDAFGDPAAGEYQALEIGAEFKSLARVPSIFKHQQDQDCSSYPARRGFSDLLQLANLPGRSDPAWTVAVNTAGGFLWFSLKDVRTLPSTVIWMENHGRYRAPWNGRNCALGLEDCCTYFDRGIGESSRENIFSERGVRTHHLLEGAPVEVRYIQGAVKTPQGFGRVVDAEFTDSTVCFIDAAGKRASATVQRGYLRGDSLR
jgi:hypothetical protein